MITTITFELKKIFLEFIKNLGILNFTQTVIIYLVYKYKHS